MDEENLTYYDDTEEAEEDILQRNHIISLEKQYNDLLNHVSRSGR
jgi:hypothetical protein